MERKFGLSRAKFPSPLYSRHTTAMHHRIYPLTNRPTSLILRSRRLEDNKTEWEKNHSVADWLEKIASNATQHTHTHTRIVSRPPPIKVYACLGCRQLSGLVCSGVLCNSSTSYGSRTK